MTSEAPVVGAIPGAVAGKVIAVTGAGHGLGRAYARSLAASGARVVVNDWNRDVAGTSVLTSAAADDVVAEITGFGGEAVAAAGDVSDERDAARIISTAVETWGRLDGVVNNAGHARDTSLPDADPADFRSLIDVHLVGTWLVCRAAAAHWHQRRSKGHEVSAAILNTTSTAGLFGLARQSGYAAAKAGVIGLSLSMAAELAPIGVRVNVLAPGGGTRMTSGGDEGDAAVDPRDPHLVSPLVIWLVSDDAADVSGRSFESSSGVTRILDGWRRVDTVSTADVDPSAVPGLLRSALASAPIPNGPLDFAEPSAVGRVAVAAHDWSA